MRCTCIDVTTLSPKQNTTVTSIDAIIAGIGNRYRTEAKRCRAPLPSSHRDSYML